MSSDSDSGGEDRHRQRKRRRQSTPEWDDSERHYRICVGESLTPRYKVLDLLGEGTFGKVVECWDRKRKQYVAVKIIRAIDKYREAAITEMNILDEITKGDPRGRSGCIQLLTWFDFRGHLCMVFPRYGSSLYDFIKKNQYQPFSTRTIRDFAKQLCKSVAYIHSINLIHTDLKPENILLENDEYYTTTDTEGSPHTQFHYPKHNNLVLIDFGGATFDDRHHTSIVSTRHYRAPEVILDQGWTFPCDMWSIGCILVEFYTGDALFQTHRNSEHLALMEKIIGNFPAKMVQKSKYFEDGKFKLKELASTNRKYVERSKTLKELIPDPSFLDLIKKMLDYNPSQRMTAAEALKHPFLK